nr:hypothetical protein Q903MT_gene5063 [Picea sitchensis]
MLASISSFISDPNSYKGRKRTLSSVFSVTHPNPMLKRITCWHTLSSPKSLSISSHHVTLIFADS